MARLRKYIEIEGIGFVGITLAGCKLTKALNNGWITKTGRKIMLDTDFSIIGDFNDWDIEAGKRIASKLGLKNPVDVVRF